MLKKFRSLMQNALTAPSAQQAAAPPVPDDPAPGVIIIDGMPPFPLTQHLALHHGFPILDWQAVRAWLESIPGGAPARLARSACARAWLLHFRDNMNGRDKLNGGDSPSPRYELLETESALLLSALRPNQARAALEFMSRTQGRVGRVLKGLASTRIQDKQLLIVFERAEPYYDYVSYYYPEQGGEFPTTGGVHVGKGYGHYVVHGDKLNALERVIAHEMTHGQLAHLRLPAWLNEGIAVNTERQLAGAGYSRYTPREMHARHRAHWNAHEIQKLWSGDAFDDARDDNQHLAYDLARIIVEQLARDWPRFTRFALNATPNDGGAQAAREHLGMDLGDVARALLERPDTVPWTPAPETWRKEEVGV
jgi:hypothetical protein